MSVGTRRTDRSGAAHDEAERITPPANAEFGDAPCALPGHDELEQGLQDLLGDTTLRVTDRRANPYASSFATEIVTCRGGGDEVVVFCKHHSEAVLDEGHHRAYGSRRGVTYEAVVYRMLNDLHVSGPQAYGLCTVGEFRWLALEYLEGCLRVSRAPSDGMPRAARWLGLFHARVEQDLANDLPLTLMRFDRDYYAGWASRTATFARRKPDSPAWLLRLCASFSESVANELGSMQETIVHGEFYPMNVLYRDGAIFPVDWESAAVGPGLVDLITLTAGWDEETIEACHHEYVAGRWGGRRPTHFEDDFHRAAVYVALRWLGESIAWFPADPAQLDPLRISGEALGLI